jgi:hypothetical protein
MKVAFLILLLLTRGVLGACLPDTLSMNNKGLAELSSAYHAVEHFNSSLASEMPSGEDIVIKFDSLSPNVNAEVNKIDSGVAIRVMGGMLGHPKMTPDTLLLLLCHEIGHYLGGPPFKSRNGWSSTEGQADYYSGLRCAKIVGMDNSSFATAALHLATIYAEVTRETKPRLDRCDERMVERINYGYPSAQCRLDTLMAGWAGSSRPRCWFTD